MKAEIIVNKNYVIDEIDKRIYGAFVEHMGRSVYGGIYDPEHESADDMGFRSDVLELVKKIDVPIVRYPGGNFVSGYRWEDGVGDKSKRPTKMECAWKSIETNQVGTDEFCEWAKRANSEVMMAVNLGTRGAEDARNLLEYCNIDLDTQYANMRRENGHEKPHKIKTWCLGNEMDGFWQIGSKTPDEYGKLAYDTAKLMKFTDPDIELVACGSSNYDVATFGEWEMRTLEHTYNEIEYLSLHQYYGNNSRNAAHYLGKSVHMDKFIKSVVAICDAINAKKHNERRHSGKKIMLSFDEWNVMSNEPGQKKIEKWVLEQEQPYAENPYKFEDALLVGCMLMTLQKNCDRVKIACMAQLVNLLAPIMAPKNGKAWVQTIFYPYMYASNYGRGKTMNTILNCPAYEAEYAKEVPYVEHSVIWNEEKRELVVFAVNRNLEEDMELDVTFENFGELKLSEHIELYSDDLETVNTEDCERVSPANVEIADKIKLKKHSWNMLVYKY